MAAPVWGQRAGGGDVRYGDVRRLGSASCFSKPDKYKSGAFESRWLAGSSRAGQRKRQKNPQCGGGINRGAARQLECPPLRAASCPGGLARHAMDQRYWQEIDHADAEVWWWRLTLANTRRLRGVVLMQAASSVQVVRSRLPPYPCLPPLLHLLGPCSSRIARGDSVNEIIARGRVAPGRSCQVPTVSARQLLTWPGAPQAGAAHGACLDVHLNRWRSRQGT